MSASAATILDAASIAAATPGPAPATLRALLLAFYPAATIAPSGRRSPTASPLVAEVDRGAWVARCDCGMPGLPAPGCVVRLDDPWGWCVRCGNGAVGGGWRPVVIPPPAERAAIEAVLTERPDPETRNWRPGETVGELVAENAAHGLAGGI